MPDARLQVVFEAVDKFSSELKALNTQVKTSKEAFNRDFGDISRTVRNAGLALTGFGAAGVLAIRSFSNAALEQRQAMAQLQVAVGNTGTAFDRVKGQIEETTLALQRKTNFADEEQLRALALMVPALGDVNVALAALPTALDLAAATGQDLSMVAMQLGRTLSGQQATMRGLPVDFSKAATAVERLALAQKALGGTAEATADPFKRMNNAFGELKETMGEQLLPTVTKVTDKLSDFAVWLQNAPPLIKEVAGSIGLTATAFSSLTGPLILAALWLPKVVAAATILAAIGWAGIITGISGIGAALIPVAAIAGTAAIAVMAWASAISDLQRIARGEEAKGLVANIQEWLGGIKELFTIDVSKQIADMQAAIGNLSTATFPAATGLGELGDALAYVVDEMGNVIWIQSTLADNIKEIGDKAQEAANKVGGELQDLPRIWQEIEEIMGRHTARANLEALAKMVIGGEEALRAMLEQGELTFGQMAELLNKLPLKETIADLDAINERLAMIAGRVAESVAKTPKTRLEEMREQLAAAEAELAGGGISFWRENWLRSLINNLRNFIAELENPSSAGQFGETPPGFPGSPEPTLQHGGIVTRPTRAIIGEAGPEAVIPLRGKHAPMFNVTLTLDGRVLTTVLGRLAENDEAVRSS